VQRSGICRPKAMGSAGESDTSRADAAVTAEVTLKDGRYAGEAIVK
jgi:hypothetical protein